MSQPTLGSLKKQRGSIKRQLTNFETALNSITDETDLIVLDLEARLKKHNNLWDVFDRIQTQIEDLHLAEAELQIHDSEDDSERTSFENRFYAISGLAKKHMQKLASLASINSTQSTSAAELGSIQGPSHLSTSDVISLHEQNLLRTSRITENPRNDVPSQLPIQYSSHFKLPKLPTPTFHGTFDTWLSFYDSFKSMCHDNNDIPTINKFMYLKACLKGEAAEVIASLETTQDNYLIAWDLLKKRFDNRKFIVESHIKALFDIPMVSKEFPVRNLLDNVQKRVRALKALDQPVDTWDSLLIFIIKGKLNNYTREKWEEAVSSTQVPTLSEMISFLEQRALIETTQPVQKASQSQNTIKKGGMNSRSNFKPSQTCMTTTISENAKSQPTCFLCSEEHLLVSCNQFQNMSAQEKYDFVKKTAICHNCFNPNHRTIDCRKAPCRKCRRRHNTLLHFNLKNQDKDKSFPSNSATTLVSFHDRLPSQVLLGTAVVEILDGKGQYRQCRALLDSCSQCNSITHKFANSLGLKKERIDLQLEGVDRIQTHIKYVTSSKIKSRINDTQLAISFLLFNEISSHMPSMPLNPNAFSIPENIQLADPEFHKPAEIDILIGVEFYYDLLLAGKIRVPGQTAIFKETEFGWIVAGRHSSSMQAVHDTNHMKASCNLIKFQELPILWELEAENLSKFRSKEEQACESHYVNNTTRDETNRYVVKLPFNEKKDSLGDSRNTAFQRFYALERKFEKNPKFKSEYVDCIQGYIEEKHMSLVPNHELLNSGYFLPHHAVVKESSLTTKTRVVFDGSAKTSTSLSLNDTLMVGPTIQEDLFSIVTRFRSFPYAFTADIQQMYRQIRVSPEDTKFQKILWRADPTEPIKIYSLNRVTFGTACAPFLAVRTLHQLADDEQESHPIAAQILRRDFYVDDLLSGAHTFQDALELRTDLIALLAKGSFILRKWASNHPDLCNEAARENSTTFRSLDPSETVKTLGLHWDASTDTILYTVQLPTSKDPITKRVILSQTAKLFDPLGLLGPVIVRAKIMIPQLWKCKITWDTPVPNEIKETWVEYRDKLSLLNNVKFQRCITIPNPTELQLHGFCDASEKAYGACLYLRSSNDQGKHHCALICSKSRVAPIKTTTLPRLELCAANLLAKLYSAAIQSLKMQFSKVCFWSDSTIALNWINTEPHTLKTFVANRVAEIQEKTKAHEWRHVPIHDNPADLISRGQGPEEFLKNNFWSHGPEWLSQNTETWPQFTFKTTEIPESREPKSSVSLKITQKGVNILEKFSKFQKLQHVVAYCFRFFNNAKTKDRRSRAKGQLSQTEIEAASHVIIRLTQAETFSAELGALSRNENVSSKSSLFRLNPFLDQGIIRVGGRLVNANIPESQKHPIVLPKRHHITYLIIRDEHNKLFHAGAQATLYGVREKYWPIDGRNATRHVVHQCVKCFRAKPRETNYLMGSLPKDRVSFVRPFEHAGVDYCGPFYIKEHRHRNRTKLKTYVAIFVCLATKAVHLELASDLTSDAFISCLSRFFARRGLSKSVSSDNATNFVGANNELKDLYKQLESFEHNDQVTNYLPSKGIDWHFIPPRAPHFGGLWEASVKSFKNHFKRVAGNSLLTYEQLHTYVVEIEAILNSRPLTPLSPDPNDLLPLTPGHFLVGTSMTSLPQTDLRKTPAHRLTCWQLAQKMRQHFWDRWYKEYLNELISRNKWQTKTDQSNIKVGTLVIIKEDNLPPMMWKLGRIIATHPGDDAVVRSVILQTASGTCKRSLKQIHPLPIDN